MEPSSSWTKFCSLTRVSACCVAQMRGASPHSPICQLVCLCWAGSPTDMPRQIYLVVMALAFFGAVAFGAYSNYRWMKRQVEEFSH
ncbi:hypothetical protein N234_13270 [Ralstonia pickettii DTP0602]|nr:hypothetical protein N234_13270 [Ralstonia pickettii DTP0602]